MELSAISMCSRLQLRLPVPRFVRNLQAMVAEVEVDDFKRKTMENSRIEKMENSKRKRLKILKEKD